MLQLYILILVIILLLFVLSRVNFSRKDKLFAKIPSPPKTFFLHNALQVLGLSTDELFQKFNSWYNEFGDVFHMRLHAFDDGTIFVADTKIAEVLSLHQTDRKRSTLYKALSRWIGRNGFFLSKGENLKNRMKIIASVFSPKMFERVSRKSKRKLLSIIMQRIF